MKYLSLVLLLSIASFHAVAQQINTLYFMENLPVRHLLNPAFSSSDDWYIGLPVLGLTQLNGSNNSLTFKDVIYLQNDQTVTFLNDATGTARFYNSLHQNNVFRADFQTNLLSFGFKTDIGHFNFSLSERLNNMVDIPKDLIGIVINGTPDLLNNSFNFTKLQTDLTAYTEAAFGYSHSIDEKLTFGGKLKVLIGNANLSVTNNNLTLNAGLDKWTLQGQGSVNESSPVQFNNLLTSNFVRPPLPNWLDWLKPSGLGAGIDLGFEYKLTNHINLSAALLDLGFISWNANVRNINYSSNYTLNGLGQFSSSTNINTLNDIYTEFIKGNMLVDSIKKAFNKSFQVGKSTNPYITGTTAKLNLGFEYTFLNNRLSLGLLSYSQIFKRTVMEEITTSINARPVYWFNAALSYSLINGSANTFGAALGIKTGIVHWFVATDYIFFQKVDFSLSDISPSWPAFKIPLPYKSKAFNVSLGVNLVFNKKDQPNKQKFNSYRTSNETKAYFNSTRTKSTNYKNKSKGRTINKASGLHNSSSSNDCRCETN